MFFLIVTLLFWALPISVLLDDMGCFDPNPFIDNRSAFIPFFTISFFTAIALFSPILLPLYEKLGLHPVLVSVALIAAGNSFFLAYQQPFVMIGDTMTKSKGWTGSHVALGGVLYAVAVLVGLFISSFYWKAIGLMPG